MGVGVNIGIHTEVAEKIERHNMILKAKKMGLDQEGLDLVDKIKRLILMNETSKVSAMMDPSLFQTTHKNVLKIMSNMMQQVGTIKSFDLDLIELGSIMDGKLNVFYFTHIVETEKTGTRLFEIGIFKDADKWRIASVQIKEKIANVTESGPEGKG